MNILELNLRQFRNYDEAAMTFEPGEVHVLYGTNAQGKTNILEAIFFLSHLRSFRTSKTRSLIRHDAPNAVIDAKVERGGRKENLKAVLFESKKQLFRHGNPVGTFSSFVGLVNAVLFCPDDLSLFSQSPKARRQFMDMELVKLSKTYTSTLSHFQNALKNRNLALKEKKVDDILIDTYTHQMIEDQIVLIEQRDRFLRLLNEKVNEILPVLSAGSDQVTIRYKTCVDPEKDIKEQIEREYKHSATRDCLYRNTQVGIHKDDIEFWLNGKLLTQTASQGQRRTALLAIKLGLCFMIREKSGQYPILLLDDVFSELDQSRCKALIQALPEQMQIFITTAEKIDPTWFSRPVRFYTVHNGKIKEGLFDVD